MDAALDTIVLPLVQGLVPATGPALFLNARPGPALAALRGADLLCRQTSKPLADGLTKGGLRVVTEVAAEETFPLVLVLPPRQREEARALLAAALSHTAPGGTVVAAAGNLDGARTMQADLETLTGPVDCLSKNKCRVVWAKTGGGGDAALRAAWAGLDAPRPILGGRFTSRPGLFAWDRVDPGSALLAKHLPADLSGKAADLGCGYGYLSAELLARCRKVKALDAYEADARAVALAQANLAGATVPVEVRWHDVTAGLDRLYDTIIANPPFHQGRADDVELGRGFIAAAAKALRPGGRFVMVANRHLPYEATLADRFGRMDKLAEADGYKLFLAVKG